MTWPDRRLLDLFRTDAPIVQAPMAGAMGAELVIAAVAGGALGSLPCAMLSVAEVRAELGLIRARVSGPVNLNFFCHEELPVDPERTAAWRARLLPYYEELGLEPETKARGPGRSPFNDEHLALVEESRPDVVSFHFGLPAPRLLARVRALGCIILASATTVKEARWLEERGVHAIIAQGAEAGGHRGMFLTTDSAAQPGTFALVPQIVDAVRVPVIAAGGIADGRGIAAAFVLGAAGVQIGTAYLRCPESKLSALARAELARAGDESTVLTNVVTGRPARGVVNRLVRELGPLSASVPAFPQPTETVAPLRASAEARGSMAFTPLWAGQAVALARELPAAELTRALAAEALAYFSRLSR